MEGSPKKEIIIAILVGLTTGVFFSFAFLRLTNKGILSPTKKAQPTKILISPIPKLEKEIVEITRFKIEPRPESIVSKPEIALSGQAPKNSTLFIITETEEKVVMLKDKENFRTVLNLIEGENQIYLTNVLNNETSEFINLTIVYQKE